MHFTLRPVAVVDEPFLYGLFAATHGQQFSLLPIAPAERDGLLHIQFRAQRNGYRQQHPALQDLLVISDAEPAGRLCMNEGQPDLQLVDIAITPAQQGLGLGKAVMKHVITTANQTGKAVRLTVDRLNLRAFDWYRRLGFEVISENEVFLEMRRPFASSLIPIPHLKHLWSRAKDTRSGRSLRGQPNLDWVADNTVICGLGLGLHETLQYLYREDSFFEQFEHWILEKHGGSIDPALVNRINAALNKDSQSDEIALSEGPLTPDDLRFWEENGYLILHNAVSPEGCQAAVQAICDFLKMDINDPDTWYNGPQGHSIWVPLLRHPAFEANRNSPRIHRAFEQIWRRTDLWMTVDQAGMNPPERPGWRFPGPHLHWDTSLELPLAFGVQGILYLTDTAAEQGAFTCVPGFHRRLEDWLKNLPPGADPRQQDLAALSAIPIAGKAGDLILWHQSLPHGSRPNSTSQARFVQYMTMRPTQWDYNPQWR